MKLHSITLGGLSHFSSVWFNWCIIPKVTEHKLDHVLRTHERCTWFFKSRNQTQTSPKPAKQNSHQQSHLYLNGIQLIGYQCHQPCQSHGTGAWQMCTLIITPTNLEGGQIPYINQCPLSQWISSFIIACLDGTAHHHGKGTGLS